MSMKLPKAGSPLILTQFRAGNRVMRPYVERWYQDTHAPGENMAQFLRRNIINLAMGYNAKREQLAGQEALQTELEEIDADSTNEG